jgi:hypothetical protein
MRTTPLRVIAARRSVVALIVLLAPLLAAATRGEPAPQSEAAVKAAFLFRFAGYVDWPAGSEARPRFEFAIVGNPELASELRRRVPGLAIDGRVPLVREHDSVEEAVPAEVLYVGPGHERHLRRVAARLGSTLVVTDQPQGLDSGATINLLRENDRVRFEVSLRAAARAGLRLRSGLLSVAARVEGHGERPGS